MSWHFLKGRASDAEENAADWAAHRSLARSSPEQDRAFEEWAASDENRQAWDATEAMLGKVDMFADAPEMLAMRREALAAGAHSSISHPARLGFALAASLLLAMTCGIYGYMMFRSDPVTRTVYATAIGERRAIRLSDGSNVVLNTHSSIEVSYSADRRKVRLMHGEAMFDVAKNPDRPFVVSAGPQEVTAVGTEFDVRARGDGGMSVLLIEGRVKVSPIPRTALQRLVPAWAEQHELAPGQRLTAGADGDAKVEAGDLALETSWNRGEVVFRETALADALTEMNRYTKTPVRLDDPRIGALRVSGVFSTDNPDDFIEALASFYPVRVQKDKYAGLKLVWSKNNLEKR